MPSGTLQLLIGAAQSAASSSNLQLWSVVSVSDPARRRALYEVAGHQAHILECPLFLVWVADLHRPTQLARERGVPSAGLDYLEMFLMASIDSALAAQNAVVAAEALGLGTVYIGALRNDPVRVAQVLELRRVDLVDGEEERLAEPAQALEEPVIEGVQAGAAVDDEDHRVRLLGREQALRAHRAPHVLLFVGLEADIEFADHNFDLERQGGGRQVKVQKQWSYGVGLRAGYVVGRAALVYGRAGFVETDFKTDYATEGGVNLSQSRLKPGLRVGGHIWVGSKAPWDEIAGDAPRFEEGLPGRAR